jgi:7,8-didemethyl-8-hydroxy-5-deazariboflavin synthase CofH subunit
VTSLGERLLRGTSAPVRAALEKSLEGRELAAGDAVTLLGAEGRDLQVLCSIADAAREDDVGDEISYVVCRNINFTNICRVNCRFCAFHCDEDSAEAYDHDLDEILERAQEAWRLGASELCIQGGIHPGKDGFWYRDIVQAIKAELPELHIHAFSPQELHFGVSKSGGMSLESYLRMLRNEGLDSIPGTAAEILNDEVRRKVAPRKLMTERWVEVVTKAHEVGLPSSATMMYGHIESHEDIAGHLELLRSLQKRTNGFTEFVPLGFIHQHTDLYREDGARAGASVPEDLRVVATSRLFLRPWITNIQVSWVKLGLRVAQMALMSGANDFGGTLMEESISNSAGSAHGDHCEPETFERLIREIGRRPYERTTLYERRQPRSDTGAAREAQLGGVPAPGAGS